MENPIAISLLNDFVFCPASIYFHMVDAGLDKLAYASSEQMQGAALHEKVDNYEYSSKRTVLQGLDVYCDEYGLTGRIDLFDVSTGVLTERKRKITAIYDGQIYQLYAYCLALREMGYSVKKLVIHSMLDNKNHVVPLPEDNPVLFSGFKKTIQAMRSMSISDFDQINKQKCAKCVYEPLCSYSRKE